MTADKPANASAESAADKVPEKTDAERDTSGSARAVSAEQLGDEQLAFLVAESDHFFRGELAHEQRASWLLALAAGLLLALWRLMITDAFRESSDLAFGLILATFGSLTVAIALSLWALWPLAGGKNPRQLEPWGRDRDQAERADGLPLVPARLAGPVGPTLWNHYLAHRRRAEVKGRRVVRINIALFIALLLGAAGILATLVE